MDEKRDSETASLVEDPCLGQPGSHPLFPYSQKPDWNPVPPSDEDGISLDGLGSPPGDKGAQEPPPSPFSQLFPEPLLSANGITLPLPASNPPAQPKSPRPVPKQEERQARAAKTSCGQCAFVGASWHDLVVHKKSHLGAKVHVCGHCGAGFTRLASLKKHAKASHSGPLACPYQGCPFRPRNLNSLRIHKRSHLSIAQMESYYCKLCKALYSDRASLLTHLSLKHASQGSAFGKIDVDQAPSTSAQPPESATPEALPAPVPTEGSDTFDRNPCPNITFLEFEGLMRRQR